MFIMKKTKMDILIRQEREKFAQEFFPGLRHPPVHRRTQPLGYIIVSVQRILIQCWQEQHYSFCAISACKKSCSHPGTLSL